MSIEQKTLNLLEFDKVLEKLSSFAVTNQGKNLCKNLSPLSGFINIRQALRLTREAKVMIDNFLNFPLEVISDTEMLDKPSYLIEDELIELARTLRGARLVKNFLKESSYLSEFASNLFVNKELEDKVLDTFNEEGEIKKDATKKLSGLYSSLKDADSALREEIFSLLNSSTFSKHLQENIYTFREDRVVFPIKASSKNLIDGIVHDVSASSLSVYIEPKQIIPLNNKIRELGIEIKLEQKRILTELTNEFKLIRDEIKNNEIILSELDFCFAKAKYAISLKACEPEILEYGFMSFEKMRHPLLSEYVENVVENDFELGKNYKSILISGANTGGKTVLLKTVGLFVLMAKSGLFLPCSSAKIFPFAKIFADIGDEQSIAQSLSTFSSHMNNIIDILKQADENTLVLLDEICSGTDPVEGVALARVILNRLANNGVFSCITTHFSDLKNLEYTNPYFKNACVMFDKNTLKPTYKLVIGIPGVSNAILISENLGLDANLVEEAKELVKKDLSINIIDKLQEEKVETEKLLEQARKDSEETQKIKKEFEQKLSDLKKDKKKIINTLKHKFDKQIDDAKEEIKDVLTEMRREKSEKIARRSYSRLAKLDKDYTEVKNKFEDKEKYTDVDVNDLKIGDVFLLKDLHQKVKLLSLPDKNSNVMVEMGLIKTKIKVNKLAMLDERLISKSVKKYTPKDTYKIERHSMSNTLDLRGYRVEDALDSLEYFLDRASLVNLTPVYIIHGHGTGALRLAVVDFLDKSPYVAKHRFGSEYEGRDGVSVVDIN